MMQSYMVECAEHLLPNHTGGPTRAKANYTRSDNIVIVFSCFGVRVVCGRCAFGLVPFAALVYIMVCLLQGCDVRFQSWSKELRSGSAWRRCLQFCSPAAPFLYEANENTLELRRNLRDNLCSKQDLFKSGSLLLGRLDRRQISCRSKEGQGGFRIAHLTVECTRLPLAGRGGKERKKIHCSVKWFVLLYGVPHAVDMFATAYLWPRRWLKFNLHDGGLCNQAPVLGGDVKLSSGSSPAASRLLALVVARRKGESEHLSSDDLGIAWRSLARGGRGAQGPDCVSISCSRVLFVKSKALFRILGLFGQEL